MLYSQTKRDLEKLVDQINEGRPQCPVGLNTLVIPRKITSSEHTNQPYVYLNCGHVQGTRVAFISMLIEIVHSFTFLLFFMAFSEQAITIGAKIG